jgi:predicted transcriptional regulator
MTTTTLRLSDELKSRVASAAEAAGLSVHGFMLHAIETLAAEAEEQAAFERLAERRWKEFQRTGEYYTIEDVRNHMLARARGEAVELPKPRKMPADRLASIRENSR